MAPIGTLRRTLLRQVPMPWAVVWVVLAIAAPTAARLAVDPLVTGIPYTPYFPAVLLSAIFLGWPWASLVVLASAVLGNYLFIPSDAAFALHLEGLIDTGFYLALAAMVVATAEALRRSIFDLQGSLERETALQAELQHRVKNNLAVVQSLAYQTARTTREPRHFYKAFESRLTALGKAYNLLEKSHWAACLLPDIAREVLQPFTEGRNIEAAGPRCLVDPASCVPLGLALHELATNAVKYGALSIPRGEVNLGWEVERGPRTRAVRLIWREAGGPPVAPPRVAGFGSRVLARQAGLLDVTLDYRPDGLVCEILVPVAPDP